MAELEGTALEPEPVSETVEVGEELTEGEKPLEPPPPQYMTKEAVEEMLKERERIVYERGWRESQSTQDKRVRDAERRVQSAEYEMAAMQRSLGDDEEARNRLLATRFQANQVLQRQQAQQDQQAEITQRAWDNWTSNMADSIHDLGIDPDDKRIDWGDTSEDIGTKQRRILAEVAKIQKEDKALLKKKAEEEVEAKYRKDNELDLVPPTTLGSAAGKRIFTAQELGRMTPDEYAKVKPEVDLAFREGRIKK
jgi:hypothetical protein